MHLSAKLAVATLVLGICSMPANAQDKLPYVEKTVWTVTYVQTKPGQFNAYFEDLSKVWLTYTKKQKEEGHILSYKILYVQFPHDDAPNLLLMVEYKDMASFDRGLEYWERLYKEVAGSLDKAAKAAINREDLRKLRGTILTRELDFVQK